MRGATQVVRNGELTATFCAWEGGWRPEWWRLGSRPMLRFKDHEFLNVGDCRVTTGELLESTPRELVFGGRVEYAGSAVSWRVRVGVPADGGPGLAVSTELMPLHEPIELLEAMSSFETPYEYDGDERQTTVMPQQPIYRSAGKQELTGAGYTHPFWYYGKAGRAHLTTETQTPLMVCHLAGADGGNEQVVTILANWQVCSFRDLFAQPTRSRGEDPAEQPFADPALREAAGRRGRKFLVGALNWNASLHKDPNVLAEPGVPLRQELIVELADRLGAGEQPPAAAWPGVLAAAWERSCRMHFPSEGRVGAWEVARMRGASWTAAAEWLASRFSLADGHPGFFYPERGTCVYAPHTRPKWDPGVGEFCGQWLGPLSYLGLVWQDETIARAADRLEPLFAADRSQDPAHIWTIGPTPQYVSAMRKASLVGVSEAVLEKTRQWVTRRAEFILDPPAGAARGDAGILAWEALANLHAARLFDRQVHEAAAAALLERLATQLDGRWESFNCAAEGDHVGCGQGRPFGHGIAAAAFAMAAGQCGESAARLAQSDRCAAIMLGLYYATANLSPVPDLDTRGWAVGSNGGRDQLCHMPPWETAFALQQLAWPLEAGRAREGCYDVLWLFAHTGLCMFPRARSLKRLYTPDGRAVYRPIESLATERAWYLSLPYLAYEEPWDQTMLAGYQGVEPLMLCLYLGGGLAESTDDRVLALVPRAALYDPGVRDDFEVHLWNPTAGPVETCVRLTVAARTGAVWRISGAVDAECPPASPVSGRFAVPPRQAIRLHCVRQA